MKVGCKTVDNCAWLSEGVRTLPTNERRTTMKLNVKELEVFARSQGYENGIELFEAIGYTAEDYDEYANGKNITRSMLLKLYREIGATDVF